jgi:hypothetical protein
MGSNVLRKILADAKKDASGHMTPRQDRENTIQVGIGNGHKPVGSARIEGTTVSWRHRVWPSAFMRGYDAFAGVIKSGGKTRRGQMVIL